MMTRKMWTIMRWTRKRFGRKRECLKAYLVPGTLCRPWPRFPRNTRAPMPNLVMAGSSTSSAAMSPPPAAFQPVLRILKRPTATPTSSSPNTPPSDSGTSNPNSYAAREARYQAARERIFGDSSSPSESSDKLSTTNGTGSKKAPVPVQIAREPKGPPTAQSGSTSPGGRGQAGDARGFGARRGKRRGLASGRPS